MTKKSRQKLKYLLKNEKRFYDEIKSVFHHFRRTIIEANNIFFLEDESPILNAPRDTKVFCITRGKNAFNKNT